MPAPAEKDVLLKKGPGAPEKFIGVAVSTLREVGEQPSRGWLRGSGQGHVLRHFGPFQVQPDRFEVKQLEMDPANAVRDPGHEELVPLPQTHNR